ncbi:MAG TPA: hypothetical protein VK783_14260 [Bacteroidia bacterium]|jgi:hypothetical protein|nr:hypothetical protein [Bacteroidia bacterium]
MEFDIRSNDLWLKSWGDKPSSLDSCVEIAHSYFNSLVKLIPIYNHRYIPETPSQAGNPIFSVYQMDIIYYGYDLASYFANEFKFLLPASIKTVEQPRSIPFWTKWVEDEDELLA